MYIIINRTTGRVLSYRDGGVMFFASREDAAHKAAFAAYESGGEFEVEPLDDKGVPAGVERAFWLDAVRS